MKSSSSRSIKNTDTSHEIDALSANRGELLELDGRVYVTHAGLLAIARKRSCKGIHVETITPLCSPTAHTWAVRAKVFTRANCKGFEGFGEAYPGNIPSFLSGAELRVAETRAVNRALRKAYSVGLCSVEELGDFPSREAPQTASAFNRDAHAATLRERLCQIVGFHQLNPDLVKRYAADYCGTATIRDASREMVEDFIAMLGKFANEDKPALLSILNSYAIQMEATA